jgi:hypothetical protein
MTPRRIRIKDDVIEVIVGGRIFRPAAVAINGGQILVRSDPQGLLIETDSFIHMDMDPEVVIL